MVHTFNNFCYITLVILIYKRIKFKIPTITFNVLKNRKPSYLLDLLQPHNPQISLRSSDKFLLDAPKIKTALASRSFCHAAPSIWNSLPFDLRNSYLFIHSLLNLKPTFSHLNSFTHSYIDLMVNGWHRV